MRYVLKITKELDIDFQEESDNYPIILTQGPDSEFIGFKTDKSKIGEVYGLIVQNFLPKVKQLLKEYEYFNFWLGDTLTGAEMIFFIDYSGKVYIQAEDTEPISAAFQTYLEENHPDVVERLKNEWEQKMIEAERKKAQERRKEQELRLQMAKRKKLPRALDERNLWPTWKVTYRGESGRIYTEKVNATDEMHAYDIAHDLFWDIADAGDDKLTDILKVERVGKVSERMVKYKVTFVTNNSDIDKVFVYEKDKLSAFMKVMDEYEKSKNIRYIAEVEKV